MDDTPTGAEQPLLPTPSELAAMLEYPLTGPAVKAEEVEEAATLALSLGLACLSVPGSEADTALRRLTGHSTAVACPVGFPWGSSATAAKLYEARDLLRRGVMEIEFVVNIGKLFSRQFQYVESELMQIAGSCRDAGARLKVVLEASRLDDDLKIIACKIAKRVEAPMVLTSAGSAPLETDAADVALIKRTSRDLFEIGCCVEGLDDALERRRAGCARLRVADPAGLVKALEARWALNSGGSSA